MKSTFKKALAAVSAAAVVATSAAVFTAVPADAIGGLAIAGVTVTMDELQANNYLVTVPVTINGNTDGWDALAFGVSWNTSEITYSSNSRGGLLLEALLWLLMTSSFLLENIIPLTTDHSRGAIISSTPISFICSIFKTVVSKIILPIGCHTANPITIREVHTAAISFQLLKNGMPNKVLFSDLHSNT